jgi:hypothetical protein
MTSLSRLLSTFSSSQSWVLHICPATQSPRSGKHPPLQAFKIHLLYIKKKSLPVKMGSGQGPPTSRPAAHFPLPNPSERGLEPTLLPERVPEVPPISGRTELEREKSHRRTYLSTTTTDRYPLLRVLAERVDLSKKGYSR